MKKFKLFAALSLLSACTSVDVDYEKGIQPMGPEAIPSVLQRLFDDLEKQPKEKQNMLVETWRSWLGMKKVPLVDKELVTFVYWDHEGTADYVVVCADFNNFSTGDRLFRHGTSRLFYKTYRMEERKQVVYRYARVSGPTLEYQMDPFNSAHEPGRPLKNLVTLTNGTTGQLEIVPARAPQPGSPIAPRDIYVYLPKVYFTNPEKSLPVVYMMDGQNLWTSEELPGGGWHAETTLEELIKKGTIKPAILVGIPSGGLRKEEYVGAGAFYKMPEAKEQKSRIINDTSLHSAFAAYVTEVIKPRIDSIYRTKPNREDTTVMGSSFGASAALYLAFHYPQIYGKVGALSVGNYSPENEQWKDKPYKIINFLLDEEIRKQETKVYLDCGSATVDAYFLPEAEKLKKGMIDLGWKEGLDLFWTKDENAPHNETAWAKRLPRAMEFLLK